MRFKLSLGVTALAAALALAAPPAGAVSPQSGGPTLTYAAQTLAINTDTAQIPAHFYTNTEFMPNGTVITFTPQGATTFVNFLTGAQTYANTPVTAASGLAVPAGAPATQTATQNTGICNGLGNANTVSVTATAISCVVNSAGTNGPSGTAFPSGANQIPTCTQSPPAPAAPVASAPCGPGPNGNVAIVFGTTTIRIAGINGASPYAVAGLGALDNPTTLVTVGSTLTSQIFVQAGPAGNGIVNGIIPAANPVATQNPNNPFLTQAATTPATTNPAITDASPVPFITLKGVSLIAAAATAATTRIDLGTNGLGVRFANATQPNGVSTAGFFGTIFLTEVGGTLDARNGLLIASRASAFASNGGPPCGQPIGAIQAACNPNNLTTIGNVPSQNVQQNPVLPASNPGALNNGQTMLNTQQSTASLEGVIPANVDVLIRGNFPTIANAFAVRNGNNASCNAALTAGGDVLPVSVPVTNSAIAFALPAPDTAAGTIGVVEYAICLITNGTQVIQPTMAANTMVGQPNQMSNLNGTTWQATASIGGAGNTQFPLLPGNSPFSTIQYNGAAFYYQNVFGNANLYPSFFRIINPSATTATVHAVLVKDNLVGATQNTAAAGGTSVFGNVALGTGAPAAPVAVLAPNDATYVTADQIATALGTTLTAGTGKATIWLISPSSSFRSSMIGQSLATGDLINLQ